MKILLVEDDEFTCSEFEECIRNTEDMKLCAITNDATEAVTLTKYHLPDVVILDLELHLGGGNGLEYLSALQGLQLVHRPLVIVTTNNSSRVILETARALGAGMILTKYEKNYSVEYVIKTISLMQNTIKSISTPDFDMSATSPADREQHLRTYLQSQLNLLGVSPKYKGYDYLIDAILLVSEDPHSGISKELSLKYRASANSIERAMQSAIKRTWTHADPQDLEKYYTAHVNPDRGAPTLMEFVHFYAKQIANV